MIRGHSGCNNRAPVLQPSPFYRSPSYSMLRTQLKLTVIIILLNRLWKGCCSRVCHWCVSLVCAGVNLELTCELHLESDWLALYWMYHLRVVAHLRTQQQLVSH